MVFYYLYLTSKDYSMKENEDKKSMPLNSSTNEVEQENGVKQ